MLDFSKYKKAQSLKYATKFFYAKNHEIEWVIVDGKNRNQSHDKCKELLFNGFILAGKETGISIGENEYTFDKDVIENKEEEIRMNDFETQQQFINDLYEDLGIDDNPKRELLFKKSWQFSHCCGREEVYNIAKELVCLIKDNELLKAEDTIDEENPSFN